MKIHLKELPFSDIDNKNLYFILNGLHIWENLPSFSIQSILDEMPGFKNEHHDFLHNTITSNYFSPSDFHRSKFSKNGFSIFHLNIASLSKHIDELRTLLSILYHPFDVLYITETRICERNYFNPVTNLDIEGYTFHHTSTLTRCGGAGVYIKNGSQYEIMDELCISI